MILDEQTAAFARKIGTVLGVGGLGWLDNVDYAGAFYRVIMLPAGRIYIEASYIGKVVVLTARGTCLGDPLEHMLCDAETVLGSQASYRVGDEFIVDFRSGPNLDMASKPLQELEDLLIPVLPEPFICSFGFRPYHTRNGHSQRLGASGLLSWSEPFRGYLEV